MIYVTRDSHDNGTSQNLYNKYVGYKISSIILMVLFGF